jgi:hypothetical protein
LYSEPFIWFPAYTIFSLEAIADNIFGSNSKALQKDTLSKLLCLADSSFNISTTKIHSKELVNNCK